MSDEPESAGAAPSVPTWRPSPKRPASLILLAAIGGGAILSILAAWHLPPFRGAWESTENAYVRGRTTVIAPQVSGYVVAVAAHDYQGVVAGAVLAKIDDRIYRARVAQAQSSVDAAKAALANFTQSRASKAAGVRSQSASLAGATAQLLRARADMARVDDLVTDGSVSIRERDQTLATLALAQAQLRQSEAAGDIARQDVRSVEVGRGALEAQLDGARAQLRLAEIDLANTIVRAPEHGQLGEVGVRLGQYVTNGTQLMALVPNDRWVIANFKEAQTRGMRPGQIAIIRVDALGNALTGRVERLAPAAGSEFAVLKPDNATGNFVKVPQRIGVRIRFDPGQTLAGELRPGMSVEAQVDRRRDL